MGLFGMLAAPFRRARVGRGDGLLRRLTLGVCIHQFVDELNGYTAYTERGVTRLQRGRRRA